MPYKTTFVAAEVAVEHQGVKIYHTYKDESKAKYWFDTENGHNVEPGDHMGPTSFDVRRLKSWTPEPAGRSTVSVVKLPSGQEVKGIDLEAILENAEASRQHILNVLRAAIESGEITR
ncbi:MAG: hypothetical protein NXI32_04975 [bacterium]|nr:hypothetical protein [bacterium]